MNVLRGLEAGADGFVTKRRPPEVVLGCLARVLDRPPTGNPLPSTRVDFLGKSYDLAAGRDQLLDILVSAFEDVVHLNSRLEQEKRRSDELLHVVLPDSIVVELKATNAVKPLCHEGASTTRERGGWHPVCVDHSPHTPRCTPRQTPTFPFFDPEGRIVMGTFELVKSLAVIAPVLGLLVLGFVITLQSGVACLVSSQGLRRLAGNFTRALFVLGACLAGLAFLQQLAGVRLGLLG